MLTTDSIVHAQVLRTNRNLLYLNLIFLAVLLFLSWSTSRYYYNFFFGPFDMSGGELTSLSDPHSSQRYYLTVKADTSFETGYEQVQKETDTYTNDVRSRRTLGFYHLILVNNRILLVLAGQPSVLTTYVGSLEPIPSELQTSLLNELKPETRQTVLPFILNAVSFRQDGYIGLAIMIPALTLVLWNLYKVFRRSIDHSTHPIIRSLQEYGDPQQVTGLIDSEYRTQAGLAELPKCILTQNWFMVPRFLTTECVKVSRILWVFKKSVRHWINFIPTFSTHKAIIISYSGRTIEIGARQNNVDRIIAAIHTRIPWIAFGYSEHLNKLFNKDHRLLIALVEQQHEEWTRHNNNPEQT